MNSLADILSNTSDQTLASINNSDLVKPIVEPPSNTSVHTLENLYSTPEPTEQEGAVQIKSEVNLSQLKTMLYSMKDQIDTMIRVVGGEQVAAIKLTSPDSQVLDGGEQVIEGVFNGEKMIGPDGQEYSVAPNYASKSKLVEGDMMKLTITTQGRFLYKQIAPTERKRIVGELTQDFTTSQWQVLAEGKPYKILTASVTFYKGKSGDEVVILVPESGESSWGAVENIINK